jgi:hypothetical protein
MLNIRMIGSMCNRFSDQIFMGCHHQPCICKMYNCPTTPLSRFLKYTISALLSLLLCAGGIQAQTDFAPGQIMFTGYNSDDPDGFSFVILADVLDGTVIYITDRGWSSSSGFRDDATGEGTISYEFTSDYPCGTTIVIRDVGTNPNYWVATDAFGVSTGIVTILTSTTESPNQDPTGPVLGCVGFGCPEGDQLFIYQLPEPNPGNQTGFVTGIHMNGGAWNGDNLSESNSQKPSGLANNEVVRFNTERDNAKYDCSPNVGAATVLQAAISNDNGSGGLIADASNNWDESDNFISVLPACTFCCGTTAPPTPSITGPNQVGTNQVFTINISGTLAPGEVWELYTAGCGSGAPVQTTTSNSFSVTAPGTAQTINYYVRTSEELSCPGFCDFISVCVVTDLYARCTDCNGNLAVCGDCLLPDPADNPNLDSGCYELKVIFVLDESGSMGDDFLEVRTGVLAFLGALNGSTAQVALIEFANTATLVNNYTVVNTTYINNISDYFNPIGFNGNNYAPNGATNWHAAMLQVDALVPTADLIFFFTDGDPTAWINSSGNYADCGSGNVPPQTPEIVNPVKLANKMKNEGAHMFMLGVDGASVLNLQRMSGFDGYVPGNNTLANSDYYVGDFATLADDLFNFIAELCRTTLVMEKDVTGPICDGEVEFRFRIINTGTESTATNVIMKDTFPSGYANPTYSGPLDVCIGAGCNPPQTSNYVEWDAFAIEPGDTATLFITVDVLGTGSYVNTGWTTADNAFTIFDTFNGVFPDDLPPTVSCPPMITIECTASTLPANTGSPTGTNPDGLPPTFTYSDQEAPGACVGEKTITRTWTATDDCGSTASCTQIIVVEDNTGPAVTCPPNITIECGSNTGPSTTGQATATDACGTIASITHADVTMSGPCSAEPIITRTWTATDACGNTSSCVQTITTNDSTPPVIVCPSNAVINCSSSTLPSNTGFATFLPNSCDGAAVITYSDDFIIQLSPPPCRIIRTWMATDVCGNTSTCNQNILLVDGIAPTITCPPNVTVTCAANTLPASTGSATATDNCIALPQVTYVDVTASGNCINEYTITRTWTAMDECENSNSCVQTIVIDDSAPPTMTCPPNLTITCTANTLPAATGTATASDNCSGVPVVTYADVTQSSPTCAQEYSITRTWTATDICNNVSTCVQTITIDDSTVPSLTCPPNITIQCTASTLPENTGSGTSTDNCDTAPAVTYTDLTTSSSTCTQEYTITRTWLSTDDCGNTSTCNQIITIDDSTVPGITCPVDITIECTVSTLPESTGSATATDNCDVSPAVTYTDITTGTGCPQEYTIARTWKATDDCGNFSTCAQTIVITDNTSPVLTCPANVTIECTANTLPANTGNATASDNCDAAPFVSYNDITTASETCPQEYTIERTWTVADDCGNTSSCVQTITVDDSTSPVLTCPANLTIECTAITLPVNTGLATASDNCDATPDVTYNDVTTASENCIQEYTITRTWSAEDVCGNTSSCVQTITVDDSTAPALTCPANVTIECTAITLPENTGLATVSDNCDASPVLTYNDVTTASENCIQEYTITRTWSAEDACGNTSSCVQVITVDDSVAPDLDCPANVTIQCLDNTLPANTGTATSSDNCDAEPTVEYTDVTMDDPLSNGYFIDRTWTSTDDCGNVSTCIQEITVTNPLDPSILGLPFDTICSGDIVEFEAEDQGFSPITYEWDFGSGSNPSVEVDLGPHEVQYTYNAENGSTGAWVILTVGSPGCEDVSDTVSNIHVNAIPDASFTVTPPGNPCILGARTFSAVAPEMPGFSYSWNFGPGASLPTSTSYGPHTIEYFTSGVKTVQLIVFSNEAGSSCGDTTTMTVTVITCPGNIAGKVLKADNTPIAGVNLRLYADQDLDGMQDNNTAIRSVFTTSLGVYSMAALTPGYYVIVQVQPAGYLSLMDEDTSSTIDIDSVLNLNLNDNIIPVTVEPSELDADNIFWEIPSPGTITGYVFEDFNNNQAPAPIEGIPGVTVELFTDANQNGIADPGGFVISTETSSTGFYTFENVQPGSYVIIEQQPADFNNVKDFDASNDADIVPNTNQLNDTIPATITNGEIDAGNYFIESSVCSRLVTTIQDDVTGSLRYMIDCAEENDTISFHPLLASQTLELTAGRLEIDKDLVIYSQVDPRLMIKSFVNGGVKIMEGASVEFRNIDVTSGLSGFPGVAFDNYGELTLWDVIVIRNTLFTGPEYLIFNGVNGILTLKGTTNIESD